MTNQKKISVIIPSHDSCEFIEDTLISLDNQILKPNEIIIIDEDKNNRLKKIIDKKFNYLNIVFIRNNLKLHPGNNRNAGVAIAKNEIIAFLDIKTIPEKNWLSEGWKKLTNENYEVVFGLTKYISNSYFQKILLYSSYGNICYKTVPGTILLKKKFIDIGNFIENVRSGEDQEWKQRVKFKKTKYFIPKKHSLTYSHLPNNILFLIQKYFLYSIDTAFVEVQKKIKYTYLLIMLILSAIIVPKWNLFLPNWDKNILYIPNITKIYIILLITIYLLYVFFAVAINYKKNKSNFVFFNLFTYFLLIITFLSAFYWNHLIAKWLETSILYIPHITKIYLITLGLISIFYRGIISPYLKKVPMKSIMPFNWIVVGCLGLLLDITKAPAYSIGGLIIPFIKKKK